MISLVANIINVFATTLHNLLLLASFTGKLIVSIVTWISSIIFGTLQSILIFFQIVYEDNITIFTEEIPASARGLIDAVNYQIYQLNSGVSDVYHGICRKFIAGLGAVNWITKSTFFMLAEVISLIKNTVILFGDTVWLIVTFIPIQLPQLIRVVVKYFSNVLINIIIDGYMSLLKLTNYLSEVPLQSFMGITSAIIIVRLCVHFRETIITQIILLYWSLIRNILYVYYLVFNYLTNSEVAVIAQIANGEELQTRETNLSLSEIEDNANAADSLCVICQERQKCVLTLPCRHVCLCTDCCRRLYGYQRTCPICRTFIYHSVTVYL